MQYLTIAEVAEILRVHKRTVWLNIKKGNIPAVKVGAQWRIPDTFLEAGTGNKKREVGKNE